MPPLPMHLLLGIDLVNSIRDYARAIATNDREKQVAAPHPGLSDAEAKLIWRAVGAGHLVRLSERLHKEGRRRHPEGCEPNQGPTFLEQAEQDRKRFLQMKEAICMLLEECYSLGYETAQRGRIVDVGCRAHRIDYRVEGE